MWRWVVEIISLLAMNAFVCSVKSYSEESSTDTDYFDNSDKCVRFLFGSWFRNPPSFWKHFISTRDVAEKSTGTRQIWVISRTPLQSDAGPLFGLQSNAKRTRDASALHWRPERGPASFCSVVGCLRLLISALFLYFFQLHHYLKWSFFVNIFPPSNLFRWILCALLDISTPSRQRFGLGIIILCFHPMLFLNGCPTWLCCMCESCAGDDALGDQMKLSHVAIQKGGTESLPKIFVQKFDCPYL